MTTTCRCGAPLGAAAVATRAGAISVLQGGVELCRRCADLGLGETSREPQNEPPPKRGRR